MTEYRRYHYVLQPETSPDESGTDSTETVYSMQDKETEYVRDVSDTCTKSDASEYTLNSLASEDNIFLESLSSDTDEFIIRTEKIIVEARDMSASQTGDHEVDSIASSDDPELGQADYWLCAQCHKSNNHPKYRYCMKCFRLRKEMFPPKPRATKKRRTERVEKAVAEGRKKRKHSSEHDSPEQEVKVIKMDSTMDLGKLVGKMNGDVPTYASMCDKVDRIQASKRLKESDESTQMLRSTMDLGTLLGKMSGDAKTYASMCEEADQAAKRLKESDESSRTLNGATDVNTSSLTCRSLIGRFGTLNTSSQTYSALCERLDKVYEANAMRVEASAPSGESQQLATAPVTQEEEVTKTELGSTSALCIMCDKAPKNGLFVHMYVAHACCCYSCALKVWKTTKKCPTCNLPACKVIKLIIS